MNSIPASSIDLFNKKVAKTPTCWLWLGAKRDGKYGYLWLDWRTNRSILAHRLSWEITFGPVPDGLCVCHQCDNPCCVRPDHLFLGTRGDNNRDRHQKGRSHGGTKGTSLPGEANPRHKLSAEQVREMRRLWRAGGSLKDLAGKYGIWPGSVYRIVTGQNWRHV